MMNCVQNQIKKMYRTFAESGRSMVEMLGVLAIMGVLTVGGTARGDGGILVCDEQAPGERDYPGC